MKLTRLDPDDTGWKCEYLDRPPNPVHICTQPAIFRTFEDPDNYWGGRVPHYLCAEHATDEILVVAALRELP